jgi:hypothetical protein
MSITCPVCEREVRAEVSAVCRKCGADLSSLKQIVLSASDSVRLGLESLREGRDREALDYAYEAWGLMHTLETVSIGFLAALKSEDSTEVTRWMRRRRVLTGELEEGNEGPEL